MPSRIVKKYGYVEMDLIMSQRFLERLSLILHLVQVQNEVANMLSNHLNADGLASKSLEFAVSLEHIMDFTRLRALGSLFSMLNQAVRNILSYNHNHIDFQMSSEQMEKYISKCLIQAIVWSYTGDSKTKFRQEMGKFIHSVSTIPLPDSSSDILDFEVKLLVELLSRRSVKIHFLLIHITLLLF